MTRSDLFTALADMAMHRRLGIYDGILDDAVDMVLAIRQMRKHAKKLP